MNHGPVFAETLISLNARRYALRPSFAALYAIESQSLPLPELLRLLHAGYASPDMLRLILSEGIAAAENGVLDAGWVEEELYAAAPQLLMFLLRGIGYAVEGAESITAEECAALPPLAWPELIKVACGMMGRTLQEFWQMTMPEYRLILEGFLILQGIDALDALPPANSHDLAAMMRRFPDITLPE